MAEVHLTTPLPPEQIQLLHAGDIVYLTGRVFTARDKAHQLLLTLPDSKLPKELQHLPLYHCGPLVRKTDKRWTVVSAGPTTSQRFESNEADVMARLHVSVIIGKGGMGPKTADALRTIPGVFLAYTGGAGVLAADQIIRVVDVLWLKKLGMADAVWVFDVKDFGPLVVGMDAYGLSLYSHL